MKSVMLMMVVAVVLNECTPCKHMLMSIVFDDWYLVLLDVDT